MKDEIYERIRASSFDSRKFGFSTALHPIEKSDESSSLFSIDEDDDISDLGLITEEQSTESAGEELVPDLYDDKPDDYIVNKNIESLFERLDKLRLKPTEKFDKFIKLDKIPKYIKIIGDIKKEIERTMKDFDSEVSANKKEVKAANELYKKLNEVVRNGNYILRLLVFMINIVNMKQYYNYRIARVSNILPYVNGNIKLLRERLTTSTPDASAIIDQRINMMSDFQNRLNADIIGLKQNFVSIQNILKDGINLMKRYYSEFNKPVFKVNYPEKLFDSLLNWSYEPYLYKQPTKVIQPVIPIQKGLQT